MAVRDILPNTIASITGLQERPVYFVTFVNEAGPAIVVKGENIAGGSTITDVEVSVQWATKMMKNVNNPLVNSKRLTPAENTEFRRVARATFRPDTPQGNFLTMPAAHAIWTKMPFVAGLTDAELMDSNGGSEPTIFKDVVKKFLVEQNWEDLGMVVAVDCFNTNWDRFSIQPDGTVLWANRGNIMFAGGRVIGLDAYFADSSDANLNGARLQNITDHGQNVRSGLDIIRNRAVRPLFAMACTRAIGQGMANVMQNTGIMTLSFVATDGTTYRLNENNIKTTFEPFANSFLQGFIRGVDDLKMYLIAKRTKYALAAAQGQGGGLPAGILERMTYIGW